MEKKPIYMYIMEDSFVTVMDAVLKVIETDSHMPPDKMNKLIDSYNEFMYWWNDK